MKKIGLVIAMQQELEPLAKVLGVAEHKRTKNHDVNIYRFEDVEIYSIITGVGRANAASKTTVLLENFDIEFILNIGTAGGLSHAPLGGVVISNSTGYGDVDATNFGYEKGQIPRLPKLFVSELSDKIIDIIMVDFIDIMRGTVITVDSFIVDKVIVNSIKDLYENSHAIEMEFASIAQVAMNYKIPFLGVKTISDSADSNSTTDFRANIDKATETIAKMLPNLIKEIKNIKC